MNLFTSKESDHKDLVAEYLKNGGTVTEGMPANGGNNEICPATREHIAKTRAAWRKEQREKTKK